MNNLNKDLAIAQIVALMNSYSFDTNQQNAESIVIKWLEDYNVNWIYLATIEALYLGRYKAISIAQILQSWSRLKKANTHFGGDFERLISHKLPRHLNNLNGANSQSNTTATANNSDFRNFSLKNDQQQKYELSSRNLEENGDFASLEIPLISTEVTPLPERKIISPPSSKPASLKKPERNSSKTSATSKGILTFKPVPDASNFFQKLKALADNQRNNQ